MELTNGTFHLQGISFQSLADEFGTPLYIYDAARIVKQIQHLKSAFSPSNVKIKYAAKALTNLSILKLMRKSGIGVDVVSLQEAQVALKAGFLPNEIMFEELPSRTHARPEQPLADPRPPRATPCGRSSRRGATCPTVPHAKPRSGPVSPCPVRGSAPAT